MICLLLRSNERERERQRERERESTIMLHVWNHVWKLPETKPDLVLIRTRIQNGDGANGNCYLHFNRTDENIFCVYVDRNNNVCVWGGREREIEREREREREGERDTETQRYRECVCVFRVAVSKVLKKDWLVKIEWCVCVCGSRCKKWS